MVDKNTRILHPQLDREFHAKMDEVKEYAVEKIDEVKNYAGEQKDKTANIIKEHPFLAVGGALVGGLLIGLLITRRRN